MIVATEKKLKASKKRIFLRDGRELQYHTPLREIDKAVPLISLLPEKGIRHLEVEIGPGKGEFLARLALNNPNHFFVGIDRRLDRSRLTENKLKRLNNEGAAAPANWLILKEDARCFLAAGLPRIQRLHVYHPDPWPKSRHHKNRFFRSPDAKAWAEAIVVGGNLSLSTDHRDYFEEILDIVESWGFLTPLMIWQKTSDCGEPLTHFEKIFLSKNEPVFKAVFRRIVTE